jgi:hypothetical protein
MATEQQPPTAQRTTTAEGPQRLPLVVTPENRSTTPTKDARLQNGFIEKSQLGEYWVYKRPGLEVYSTLAGAGQGVYNWNNLIYSVFGNTFYETLTSKGAVDGTGFVYTFSSTLGSTPRLFFQNGVKGYTYTVSGGVVQVTDVDYPSATVPGNAYLDGTTYVMNADANIYGSDINDPTSWDPLNLIKAQIEPDKGVAIAKQLVYVIAFKQWSTEVFYDAANSTGSPLSPVQGAKVNAGCRHAGSVQDIDGALVWISSTRAGHVGVMAMDNLKAAVISTPAIERLLQDADFTTVRSAKGKVGGHKFYCVTVINSNITLVYDLTSSIWYQWFGMGQAYFPFLASTFDAQQQNVWQHNTDGKLYQLDINFYNDAGSIIEFDLYTPNYDAGSRYRKMLNIMDIIADQTNGSLLKIRSSDDDYQTWSNFRTVDLSQKRPFLTDCGTFRRRAHHLQHRSNTPLRIQAIELQMMLGTL